MAIPWDDVLARYQALAKNVAAGLLGSVADAEDVVQEAMLSLVNADRQQPGRFATPEHARNYLLKSVRYLALKRRERAAFVESLPPGDVLADRPASAQETSRERVAGLERAVAGLDPRHRELFELRFRRRRTLAQIAAETGVAISTLHSREKSLITTLRRAIERTGDWS